MNQNHIEIITELHQIIDEFCEISSTHHEYAGSLSKELNQSIEKAILDEFNTLYALHIEKLTASTGIELYALQAKNGMTIPQRRRRWYTFWKKTPNPAAKTVEENIYNHAEWFFQDLLNRTAAITELKQLLEQAQAAQDVPSAASEETPETITLPPQPRSPAAQPIVKWPSETAQEKPAQDIQNTTSEETPASKKPQPIQHPEAPTEQPPAQPPAPALQKPTETWEEEHAIPSETLSNPSQR